MICQGCYMNVPDNDDGTAAFHPYLHCVIWKAERVDPEKVLAGYGYTRVPSNAEEAT